jgi:hypothetical protein
MPVTPFYIASANTVVRAVNAADVISTLTFTSTDPTYIANGGFGEVWGMVADALGNVYAVDAGNGGIFKITPSLNVTLVAGTSALLGLWIAIDSAGNLYFSDGSSSRIRAINMQSTTQTLLNVVIAAGANAVVAGTGVSGYSGDGGQAVSAKIVGFGGVFVDASGNLYIADTAGTGGAGNRIRKVSTAGVMSTVVGTGTAGFSGDGGAATSAKISDAAGVTCDTSGNIYLFDFNNSRVRAVNVQATTQLLFNVSVGAGDIETIAGTGTSGETGDGGAAISAKISVGNFVSIDTAGNLFLCDAGNYRVRMITPGGTISTVAGTGTSGNTGDGGAATSAEIGPNLNSLAFASPSGPITIMALLEDPSSTPLLSTSQAWVRFRLRGYTGSTPVAGAAAVLCETQIDAIPNGSGEISQVLWPNSLILPAGTWYAVEYFNENRITSSANYFLNASGDLSSQTQINPPPVPPPL